EVAGRRPRRSRPEPAWQVHHCDGQGDPGTPAGWWAGLRWVVTGGAAGLILAFATQPGPLDEVYPPRVVNPLAVSGPAAAALDWAGRIGSAAMLGGIALCAVSLLFRYRQ